MSNPPPWYVKTKWYRDPGASIRFRDGLVAASTADNRHVITSPNMTFIPRPVYGMVTVSIKSNGHYGIEDPIQWPQFMEENPRYAWLAAVSRRPEDEQDPRYAMWEALLERHFEPLTQPEPTAFGTVCKSRLIRLRLLVGDTTRRVESFEMENGRRDELHLLHRTMIDAFDRLDFPTTYRNMVRQHACVQRYWMLTHAWLEWHVHIWHNFKIAGEDLSPRPPVRDDLMGAFTTSPTVAQKLFGAGIPIWLARIVDALMPDDVLESVVPFTPPSGFPLDDGNVFTSPKAYVGLAGREHLSFIHKDSHCYDDIAPLGLPHELSSASRPLSYTSKTQVHAPPGPPIQAEAQPFTRSAAIATQVSFASQTFSSALPQQPGYHDYAAIASSSQVVASKGQSSRYAPYPSRPPEHNKKPDKSQTQKPAKKKKKKVQLTPGERDRFADLLHPYMPPNIPVWQAALASGDRAAARTQAWPYWLPDPGLVIGPSLAERASRYLNNWLRVREPWCDAMSQALRCAQLVEMRPMRSAEWREYLNIGEQTFKDDDIDFTKIFGAKATMLSYLTEFFAVPSLLHLPIPGEWFGQDLQSSSESQRTIHVQQMIWELSELSFYSELLEFDRYATALEGSMCHDSDTTRAAFVAAVFPPDRSFPMKFIPASTEGLGAENIWDRVQYLEALRQLMCRWPSVPAEVKECAPLTSATTMTLIQTMEKRMAYFYCQAFLEASGRPAIVPRRLPRADQSI